MARERMFLDLGLTVKVEKIGVKVDFSMNDSLMKIILAL